MTFTEAYRNKIQEIRDVVTGRKKIKEFTLDRDEDTTEDYGQKIEKLFESLQKKILDLNLSEDETMPKIPTKEGKDVAKAKESKQWYDGTYYTCNQCAETIYGGLAFKKHMKTDHDLQSKDLMNLVDFSSHHQELAYACLACEKTVNHQFNSIYDHLRRSHSLSIGEYESQFLKKAKKALTTDANNFRDSERNKEQVQLPIFPFEDG